MWQNLKNSKTRVRKPSSNSIYNYLRSRKLIILNLIFFPSWKLLSSLIFYDSSRTYELALLWAGIQLKVQFSSVQSLTHVQLFESPWTAACQASLSITNSQSLLKPMFIESVMPSSHRILCRHLLSSPSENPINSMKRLKYIIIIQRRVMVAYTMEVEMEEGHGVHNTETITNTFSRLS